MTMWTACTTTFRLLLALSFAWRTNAGPTDGESTGSTGTAAVNYFHAMNSRHCESPKTVKVTIEPMGANLTLELAESSSDFISRNFHVDPSLHQLTSRPCYYQGAVTGTAEMAVAKISNGMLRVTFQYNGAMYEAWDPTSGPDDSRHQLTASRLPPAPTGRCGVTHGDSGHRVDTAQRPPELWDTRPLSGRVRRSPLAIDTHSLVPQKDRKYILLVLVGDAGFYKGMNSSVAAATTRLLEIGNYLNGLYKQLGVSVVTVKAEVWTSDPFPMLNSSEGVNGSDLMQRFFVYRGTMMKNITHTAAHLVTGYKMADGLAGIAPLGKLCIFPLSGGVNADLAMNGSAYSVATTVAHELGHNLGMNHDDTGNTTCYCPDPQGCIMQTAARIADPVRFSECSVSSYLQFSVPNGLGYCMLRPPEFSPIGAGVTTCGNGILEPGEDCDCGLPAYCNNSCCNPTTCKFYPGAKCASGQCCNTTSCSLLAQGTSCRDSRGVCDLPEFCDGSSEWCPKFDDHLLDGTVCATDPESPTKVQAFCYQGDCKSRDARCSELFKGSTRHAGIDQVNTSDVSIAYCSYGYAAAGDNYTFSPCSEENKQCGTLYCRLPSTAPPSSNWMSVDDDQLKQLPDFIAKSVATVMIDLTPTGYRDPGMVPNGAECGTDKMCVSSQCLPLTSVAGGPLPDCHGHGRWTQSRLCYCDLGYAPPECVRAGAGGSISNHPPAASPWAPFTAGRVAPLGAGIGIGLAIAGFVGAVAGLSVWIHRRRVGSSDATLLAASPSPVTMVMSRGGGEIKQELHQAGGSYQQPPNPVRPPSGGFSGTGFDNPMTRGPPARLD